MNFQSTSIKLAEETLEYATQCETQFYSNAAPSSVEVDEKTIKKLINKMKKIFSKLENKNEEKVASNFVANYTGKSFQINRHCVVVEEILAEGGKLLKTSNLFCSNYRVIHN